jgi:hypothetical protein
MLPEAEPRRVRGRLRESGRTLSGLPGRRTRPVAVRRRSVLFALLVIWVLRCWRSGLLGNEVVKSCLMSSRSLAVLVSDHRLICAEPSNLAGPVHPA